MVINPNHRNKNYIIRGFNSLICFALLLLAETSTVFAQPDITRIEYFINNDPGIGNGIPVNLTPASNIQNLPVAIDITSLSQGINAVYIRARDANGNWGFSNRWLFIKPFNLTGANPVPDIVAAEWYIDTDPGTGNATTISFSPGTNINNISANIDPAQLTPGMHSFFVRVKNANGNWGLTNRWLFLKPYNVTGNAPAPQINGIEWFVDKDPGYGRANKIVLIPGDIPSGVLININPDTLNSGIHSLYVRARDANGSWSLNNRWLFTRAFDTVGSAVISNIIAIEYYIDKDPGYGKGVPVNFTLNTTVSNLSVSIPVDTFQLGQHKLYIRARNANGNWSMINTAAFQVDASTATFVTIGNIADSTCAGSALAIPFAVNRAFETANVFTAQLSDKNGSFANPVALGSLTVNLSDTFHITIPSNTEAGFNYRVRIISTSPIDTSISDRLILLRKPQFLPGIDGKRDVCMGTETYTPGNIEPGFLYTWQLSGGGTLDTSGSTAIVHWTTPGTYNLTLQANNKCGTGPSSFLQVRVSGSAPSIAPFISVTGRILNASSLPADATGYQWYRNDTLIAGATAVFYNALNEGSYAAKFTNLCGAGPASNTITFLAQLRDQEISFPVLSNKLFGDPPFVLGAMATSGLPVIYAVSGPAHVSHDTLTITGAGTVSVQANQPGDTAYNAAPSILRSFTVSRTFQTVTFDSIPSQSQGQSSVILSASASSGLPVTFSIVSGHATLSGNVLTPTGAGTIIIRANQTGNQNYQPAFAERSFCVPAQQPGPIQGFREACAGPINYRIDPVPGTNYLWSLSGGGTLSSNTGSSITINWTTLGSHEIIVSAIPVCVVDTPPSRSLTVMITNALIPGAPVNLFPANAIVVHSLPFSCSWQPSVNASLYDVYIWPENASEPGTATITGISQIGTLIRQNHLDSFAAGKTYRWKVVARNACEQTASAIQTFTISDLPDLVVSAIQAPSSAFSGQTIDVTYEIKNTGKENSRSATWYDAVYLSADTILNKAIDTYLGAKANTSALSPGQSYTNTLRGLLPNNIIGSQYILVETDSYNTLGEESAANNISSVPIIINLTPPPDLEITTIVTPGDAFSGETINLRYTVKNTGTGDTKVNHWRDVIYMSPDSVFNANAAIRISDITYNSGALKVDSSYTKDISILLPDRDFGTYYFYIVTDAGKEVFEFVNEDNNTAKSDPLNVYLTPPPDFVVTEVNNPPEASTGETILIDWTVQNDGATAPRARDRRWSDGVYISKDSVFNNHAIQLTTRTPSPYPVLNPGENYFNSTSVVIPGGLKDTCYIYVATDRGNAVFEYLNEDNNTRRNSIVIKTPDLIVTTVQAPQSGASGNDITVEWTVSNQGLGKVPARSRTDQIWLSTSPDFNSSTVSSAGSLSYDNPMDPGASLSKQKRITFPNGIAGTYYLFVETDLNNSIYEGGLDTNNRALSQPIQVSLSPWADLKVISVEANTDSVISEKNVGFRYKVANQGTGDITATSWRDNIYISKDSVWNSSATLIKTITRTQFLPQNDVYEAADSFFVSMNLLRSISVNMTNCYLYVFTDAANAIYEYTADTNNIGRSKAVYASHAEHTDLVMTQVSLPDSLASGNPASIEWSVTNKGGITGYYGDYWYDGIFVSQDTIFNSSDAFITDKVLYGPLDKNKSYTDQLTFTVPNGLSGNYYLLMVADHKNFNRDKNTTDNYKTITRSPGPGQPPVAQTINVTLTPSPDLTVTSYVHPSVGYAGQPILIRWKVLNLGPGIAKNGWTERIYLSTDNKVDGGDKALETYSRKAGLDSNEYYEDSMEVFIPRDATGNYYLLFRTDNNNIIYEHGAEDNNIAAGSIFIIQPDPSDLIVSGVTSPASANFGDTVTISWVVKNTGSNPATGRLKEGIYFSRDSLWSNDDVLVSTVDGSVQLSPEAEVQHSSTVTVTGVAAGNYFVIVRTDLADNLFEENEDNNTGAAAQPVTISLPELPLNVLTPATLRNNADLYYRLEIPGSLAGETVLVSLKGDVQGANELYIKYDNIPTRANYDFAYSRAISGDQDIVVPAVNAGAYYILVHGATTSGNQQAITLLAKKINFEILTVASNEGGNTGSVTVKINGAKFENGMQASLYDPVLGMIMAHAVTFINSTTVFASFNLAGRATGMYDVKLKKNNNDSTSLADGFTIVTGSGGTVSGGGSQGGGFYCTVSNIGVGQLLQVDVQYPEATRTRRVFPMVINFGNSSNVDIPIPTRIMVSLGGDPIAMTAEGIAENKKELYIEFKELNGPPDVLRPGVTGAITVFTLSQTGTNLRFRLIE